MLTPLKVTFRLDTPMVATGYPIHLDALIAYAVTKQAIGGMEEADLSDESIRSLADSLPLERHEQSEGWVWKASAVVPVKQGESAVRMWTRKTNTADFAARAAGGLLEIGARTQNALAAGVPYTGVIDTARGLLKNQFDFYPTVEIFEAAAWCLGDIDMLEMLLAPESGLITHLGKRGRIGHGHIAEVEIETCPDAAHLWKQRVLPWQESREYVPIQAAFHPPYWAAENRAAAFVPIGL